MSQNVKTWLLTLGFACLSITVFVATRQSGGSKGLTSDRVVIANGPPAALPEFPDPLPGRFRAAKFKDGDTCDLTGSDGIEITVRLAGIDSPELGQDFGQDAKEMLIQLLQNRSITLSEVGKDKYGRFLAQVHCDGLWVNREMIVRGAAWTYLAGAYFDEFSKCEEHARARRVGLWSLDAPKPPWEARK